MERELDALTARLAAQPPPAMAADVEALRQEVPASWKATTALSSVSLCHMRCIMALHETLHGERVQVCWPLPECAWWHCLCASQPAVMRHDLAGGRGRGWSGSTPNWRSPASQSPPCEVLLFWTEKSASNGLLELRNQPAVGSLQVKPFGWRAAGGAAARGAGAPGRAAGAGGALRGRAAPAGVRRGRAGRTGAAPCSSLHGP